MSRSQFNPTTEHRNIVKSMAAMGIPHEDIGRKIGIRSAKTLRKYFRDELDHGATEANYKVATTLYNMAISGEHPAATIFWAKTRNRFREHSHATIVPVAPAPFIVVREQEGGQS
jgi:hypothetical protein